MPTSADLPLRGLPSGYCRRRGAGLLERGRDFRRRVGQQTRCEVAEDTARRGACWRVCVRFAALLTWRPLGRSGFGDVYEADDTVMDRVVALKLLAAPVLTELGF